MSRLFDGVDDVMSYALTAGTALNDALSLLLVFRIVVTADNTWLSLLEGERSTGTIGCAMGRRDNGDIYFANAGSLISNGDITDADNWMILAVTRSAAAATSSHKLPIGGSRTTTAYGALADSLSLASGTMRIGGNDDFANIKVAAAAFWDGTELTTTQLDGILSALTTQSIADLSPTWLVDDSDAFLTNLINPGVMDRTAITGTADDADDPAGWVYGLGGAGPQNVPVTGHTSTSSYGAVTTTTGGVEVNVTGRTSSSSYGTVNIAVGNINTGVTGHTSSSAYGTVTAQPGNTNSPVTGHTSGSSYGTVTTTVGGVTVNVTGRTSQSQYGGISTTGGTVTRHVRPRHSALLIFSDLLG